MKILHICAADENSGAGRACQLLNDGLIHFSINSNVLYINSRRDNVTKFETNIFNKVRRFIFTKLDRLVLLFYPKRSFTKYFSPGIIGLKLNELLLKGNWDLVHIHWVNHGFINIESLRDVSIPIVWTMHDFWSITGGCHYFYSCNNFEKLCGNCEILGSHKPNDISRNLAKRKRVIYESIGAKLTFVPVSNWVRHELLKSPLVTTNIISGPIFSGVDLGIFQYQCKSDAREKLGIQQSEFVILLGATDLRNPAKGFSYILDALLRAKDRMSFKILYFGESSVPELNDFESEYLGYIRDRSLLSTIYAASDLFLSPSINETFGMTLAEAQCVGCPVLAFNRFGPQDIVLHQKTGYLAEFLSVEGIVDGIQWISNADLERNKISEVSSSRLGISNTSCMYIDLYKTIIK